MTTRPLITAFVKKDCVHCERAKATLRDAGMAFFTKHDTDDDQHNADAAVYLSGKVTVPQIFMGDYPLGGADDVGALWQTRRLRDIATTVDPHTRPEFAELSDEELARGAEDIKFTEHIPPSDGTHTEDSEQWPILYMYREFFGFWPHTFVYLHHWPEAYKRFVYCQNAAAIGMGKNILDVQLLSAVAYTTSNAHGCNYCQVHSVATLGDESMDAVEQLRLARIGQHSEDNPFDEYWVSLADLSAMASLNTVPEGYLDRLRHLAQTSEHQPANVNEQIMAIALISASFGFLNVFNDLMGMDIEGGWATRAKERLDLDFGRHAVNEDRNPDNLSHELPTGGPTMEQMMGKYAAEVGDLTAYAITHFGLIPSWLSGYPPQMRPLQAALYGAMMSQKEDSSITPELKHLLAYVAHIEKGHVTLAHTEACIAHHVAADRPRTLQRLQHSFAVASGRGVHVALFSEAERAALCLAYLSAQTPLITPRRFVQPVMEHFDAQTCVELFVVCGIASMIQRFAAIMTPPQDPVVDAFVAEHNLSTDLQVLRFPLY
ncbi:MAG: glutaredoxin domain-containing protein [Chloroflexota bacterium]